MQLCVDRSVDVLLVSVTGYGLALIFALQGAPDLALTQLLVEIVTTDELYATGATFTVVAWGFAYTYTVCQAIEPGSSTPSSHAAS